MKKTYRRALLFGAILVFMAVTPVVILYAIGYRGGLTTADPVPVGVLLIETEPSQADVYINDTFVGVTPRSVPNLQAGGVNVRIAKDGYTPWQKNLPISPGRATEIRDVRLFPQKVQTEPIKTDVHMFSLSPNRRLLATHHTNNTLAIYDPAGQIVIPPQPFAASIQSVLWSPNSDALLVKTTGTTTYWYVSITQEAVPVPVAPLATAQALTWDPRIPGRVLYLDTKNSLQAYHLYSKARAPLLENIQIFATSAGSIYAMSPAATELTEYTLQGEETGTTLPLPTGKVQGLFVTPQQYVALLLESGEVWVLNDDNNFELVGRGMKSLAWSPSGRVLLLTAHDSALYVYNVNDKRTTLPLHELRLVQRLSRPISDPQWFAGNRHFIYHVDDEIWITETDTRDRPMSNQIDTTNTGAAQATVGEEGEILFYLKKTGATTNLVAAPLLVE